MRLDIACGKNKKPDFIGVDVWDGADIVCDLEQFPWPFNDNSVDEIFCSHYIEHVPDLVSFANELYRIMKPGAKATIIAPYYSSIRAWQDPTHVRAISENTFQYFRKDWREARRLDHYPIVVDFEVVCGYKLAPDWRNKEGAELEFAMKHYINVVDDIIVEMLKIGPNGEGRDDSLEKAHELWACGETGRAFDICYRLVAGGNRHVDLLTLMAEYYFRLNAYTEALDLFKEVLGQDEVSCQGNVGFLRTLHQMGRDGEAQAHVLALNAKNPEFAQELEELLV